MNRGAIVAIAVGVAGAIAVFMYTQAKAAPPTPPEGWCCPYCQACFDTYEELVAHVQTEHPGERIPLPIEWE